MFTKKLILISKEGSRWKRHYQDTSVTGKSKSIAHGFRFLCSALPAWCTWYYFHRVNLGVWEGPDTPSVITSWSQSYETLESKNTLAGRRNGGGWMSHRERLGVTLWIPRHPWRNLSAPEIYPASLALSFLLRDFEITTVYHKAMLGEEQSHQHERLVHGGREHATHPYEGRYDYTWGPRTESGGAALSWRGTGRRT